jgi:hypothetical protein
MKIRGVALSRFSHIGRPILREPRLNTRHPASAPPGSRRPPGREIVKAGPEPTGHPWPGTSPARRPGPRPGPGATVGTTTGHSAVRWLRKSRVLISGFDRPSRTSRAICASCGGVLDPAVLAIRADGIELLVVIERTDPHTSTVRTASAPWTKPSIAEPSSGADPSTVAHRQAGRSGEIHWPFLATAGPERQAGRIDAREDGDT